jgi:hypothetical protein
MSALAANSHRYISVLGRGVGPEPAPAAAAVGVVRRGAAASISRVCRAFAASVAGIGLRLKVFAVETVGRSLLGLPMRRTSRPACWRPVWRLLE